MYDMACTDKSKEEKCFEDITNNTNIVKMTKEQTNKSLKAKCRPNVPVIAVLTHKNYN